MRPKAYYNEIDHQAAQWLRNLIAAGHIAPGVPVFGEQVANGDGLSWLDLVSSDMEGAGYAFRAVDLCAAGIGAPIAAEFIKACMMT